LRVVHTLPENFKYLEPLISRLKKCEIHTFAKEIARCILTNSLKRSK
jgi:hypothetical protein